MLFFDVSLSEWRNQVKERKPSKQHRMRASIKKSTLKATETRKEGTLPGLNPVDKDKDVYLKAVRYVPGVSTSFGQVFSKKFQNVTSFISFAAKILGGQT